MVVGSHEPALELAREAPGEVAAQRPTGRTRDQKSPEEQAMLIAEARVKPNAPAGTSSNSANT
jgi:hypothetical protein